MKHHLIFTVFLLAVSSPVYGQSCPPIQRDVPHVENLIGRIQLAPNEGAARAMTGELWSIWMEAPDDISQEILDRAMSRFRAYNLDGAIADFTDLISYCPDYAEGYNQRAFAQFIKQDFDRALSDLNMALALDPLHIAALSGKALTLLELGRVAEGQKILREALELNPWLPERSRLAPIPGQEL